MAIATIVIKHKRDVKKLARALEERNDNPRVALTRIANLLSGLVGGAQSGSVLLHVEDDDAVAAELDVVCVQAEATAGDTVTIAGVVFTAAASPSSDPSRGEFAIGASNTALGANLAAAVNRHPRLDGLVSATAVTGTMTLAAGIEGVSGGLISFATDNDDAFDADDATALAGGAPGTVAISARVYRRGV